MTLNELKAKRKKLIRQYNQIDRQAKRLSHEFTKALNEPDITGTEFRRIETASKNAFNVKAKIDGELLKIENQILKMKSKNPTVIKAKKIGHIDVSKVHNPKFTAAEMAKIENAKTLVQALGYTKPLDVKAALQDTLYTSGFRGRRLLVAVQIAAKKISNPKRKRNLDHKDADHPIDVSEHWRSGPPGYMSPWQRAAALGQSELFSTGIQLSKRAQELRGRRGNPEKLKWDVRPSTYNDLLKKPVYYARASGRGYQFNIWPELDLSPVKFEGYRMSYQIYYSGESAEYPKRLKSLKAMQAAAQKILNASRIEEKKYFALSDIEKLKLKKNPGATKAAYRSGLKEASGGQLVKLARIGLRTGHTAATITADLKKTGRFTAAQISRAITQAREAEQKAKQNPGRGTRKYSGSREFKAARKTWDEPKRRLGHVELPDNFTYEEGQRAIKSADNAWRKYADKYDKVKQRKTRKTNGAGSVCATCQKQSSQLIQFGKEKFCPKCYQSKMEWMLGFPNSETKRKTKQGTTSKRQTRKSNGAASAVKKIFEKFGGRASTKTKTVSMPNGTPTHVAKLGTLRLIKLKNGSQYKFIGKKAPFLAADHRGKLHVVGGQYRANPPGHTLGEIETIEYETTKPHLGQNDETIYFHHLGEETGERPTMRIDSEGLIKIIGGAYTIEADGIHN